MTATPRPHSWPVAALVGAGGVIAPLALAFGAWRFVETRRLLAGTAAIFPATRIDAGTPWLAAVQSVAGFALIGAGFGLPIAFALTAAMARLERSRPAARTLPVWWLGAAIASSPLAVLFFWGVGIVGAVVATGLGLAGATIAWWWRHRRPSPSA